MRSRRRAWQVSGYTHIRDLGAGGAGRVVLARHDADGSHVAIKYLSGGMLTDPEFVERFRTEARLIASIDSPHIARLREYVEGEDGAAIVMELVDGVTLRRLLREQGTTGPEAALVVLKGALLGLVAAHQAGVVHRDFKPENVIVTVDGGSRLVDFGIAVPLGESGRRLGTPPYMAPELWQEAPASPATDVYAATIVFFECLAGSRPFHADDIAALAYQHENTPPPIERVQEPVRPLVEHGLAKEPWDRPSSAGAFLAELEELAVARYGPDWERNGRLGLGGLAAALVGFGAVPPAEFAVPHAGSSLVKTVLVPAGKLVAAGALAAVTVTGIVTAVLSINDSANETPAAQGPAATAPRLPTTPTPSAPPTADPTPSEAPTDPEPPADFPVDQRAPIALAPPDAAPPADTDGAGSDGAGSDGSGSDGSGSDGSGSDGSGSDGSSSDGAGSDGPGSDGPGSDGPGSDGPDPGPPAADPDPEPADPGPPPVEDPGPADEPPSLDTEPDLPEPDGGEAAAPAPEPQPDPQPPAQEPEAPGPPPPAAADPGPGPGLPDPPARENAPLLDVRVSASLGLPLLGGDSGRLLDADILVGITSGLLGPR
ncbi:hypothetical protein Misp01_02870 [Microtetraspora sp. NBRC 13810]|uniref:serine/threonine-protein kinase n=1 Tax=Microtetraspora sp. NBRC 13810 TaxID=3030990 RepID=UPI0024A2EE20|nr:serine/threonine-protein kinase [Microtetraspora sp. NBRC 13810]GLW05157.1 hypothetical protein Misp01_02870 [Microtetraspora sp. NBRC 13810]